MIDGSSETCQYEHGTDDDRWTCPHGTDDGHTLCLFHRDVEEKDDGRVADAFLECATSRGQRVKEFVGATFGELDLEHTKIDAEDNYPIVLEDATFEGQVTWSFAVVRQPLRLHRATFATETLTDDVDFDDVFEDQRETAVERDTSISAPNYFDDGFEGAAAFPEVSFDGGVDFRGTTFAERVRAPETAFHGVADFWGTDFQCAVTFEGSTFNFGLLFDGATFDGVVDFSDTKIDGGCVFERATATREFLLADGEIDGDCVFSHMNFGADASFENTDVDGKVNLEGSTFEGRSHSINLRYVRISGELNWSFSTVKQPLHMQGAEIATETEADNPDFEAVFEFEDGLGDKFEGSSPFPDVGFDGGADFRGTTFEKTVIMQGTTIDGIADFWGTEFERGASFEDCTFAYGLLFDGADFHDVVDFAGSHIYAGGVFERVTVCGAFSMTEAEIHGNCVFRNASFESDATFNEAHFHEDVDFSEATFGGTAKFVGMQCLRRARFTGTAFEGSVHMQPETGTRDRMAIDLSESSIQSGSLGHSPTGEVIYNLREATIGKVSLEGCEEHPLLEHYRVENTVFDEFEFASIRDELAATDWRIHGTFSDDENQPPGKDYAELETTYLLAKNGAIDIGEQKAAAEFFLKEMKHRRKHHWQGLVGASQSLAHRLRAGGRWVANTALMLTSGYGERPWHVVGTAAAIIGLFAIGFALVLPYKPYESSLGYLILSSESFITLVLGGSPQITNEYVRLAADIEGFFGAFLIALFVFTLTRSISR